MSLLPLWFVAAFLAGLFAGGLINYCAKRLPYERALLWPRPHCLSCFQALPGRDCLPLLGYAMRRGRCRWCGTAIPASYPVVELATGVLFVALFALVAGVLEVPGVGRRWAYPPDARPGAAAAVFAHHAVLLGLLLVASLCDLADMEIPFTLTLWGTLAGVVLSTLFPWPTPTPPAALWGSLPPHLGGVHAWPVWHPLPAWLPAGSPQLGLATGLAGALAGMLMLRGVRFLFGLGRGLEGLGVGDADLMMMAGAFIGWQPVVMAFFVAILPALAFALVGLAARGSQALPFGPSLALGVVITVLAWPVLGEQFHLLYFHPVFLGIIGGGGAAMLLALASLLRLFRWLMDDSDDDEPRTPRRAPTSVPTAPPPAANEGE